MANRKETFDLCLDEMLRRAGRCRSKRFLSQDDWYSQSSWTREEERDFKEWMVSTIRKRERWPKSLAEKEASKFLLCYGWSWVPEGCMKVT